MKASEKKSRKKAKKRVNKGITKKAGKLAVGKGPGAKKGETDLQNTFMENILVKKRELEKTLELLIDSQKEYDVQLSGGDFIDELDRAQREISASSYYPIIERKIKELQKIERLINRMSKDENFGLCEECGQQIPKERLLIVPEASLCVSCQRALEKMDFLKGVEARTSTDFGGEDWKDSVDFDDRSYRAVRMKTNKFSVTDIRGTEPENDFVGEAKGT